jgi:hypothetical protein
VVALWPNGPIYSLAERPIYTAACMSNAASWEALARSDYPRAGRKLVPSVAASEAVRIRYESPMGV